MEGKRVFRIDPPDNRAKCGGCNWEQRFLYVLADTQEEAEQLYRDGDAGLCGDCFTELLMEGYTILPGSNIEPIVARLFLTSPGGSDET